MKKDTNQVNTSQDTYKRIGLIAFGVLAGILMLFFFLFKYVRRELVTGCPIIYIRKKRLYL